MEKLDNRFRDWKELKDLVDDARAGMKDIKIIAKKFYFGCKAYQDKYNSPFHYNNPPTKEESK